MNDNVIPIPTELMADRELLLAHFRDMLETQFAEAFFQRKVHAEELLECLESAYNDLFGPTSFQLDADGAYTIRTQSSMDSKSRLAPVIQIEVYR